jgi:alpha-beta hydrolase superfamily lysophospholipase
MVFVVAIIVGIALGGWGLFSLAAGAVLFRSTLVRGKDAFLEKALGKTEGANAMAAHTRDPVVMNPIQAAKERWRAGPVSARQSARIRSFDGLTLAGEYWPTVTGGAESAAPSPAVVIVHGKDDTGAGMAYLAEGYHSRGFDCLLIDARAHGESAGSVCTMGVREAEDLSNWVDWLVDVQGKRHVFVHGVSMGAATAIIFAGRRCGLRPEVAGIISDSSYARYDEAFARLLFLAVRNRFVSWSITLGASVASRLLGGVSFGSMNPVCSVGRVSVPMLLFHGQADVLVTVRMVRDLFAEAARVARAQGRPVPEIVVVPEAPHIGPFFYAPELYWNKIETFCSEGASASVAQPFVPSGV